MACNDPNDSQTHQFEFETVRFYGQCFITRNESACKQHEIHDGQNPIDAQGGHFDLLPNKHNLIATIQRPKLQNKAIVTEDTVTHTVYVAVKGTDSDENMRTNLKMLKDDNKNPDVGVFRKK